MAIRDLAIKLGLLIAPGIPELDLIAISIIQNKLQILGAILLMSSLPAYLSLWSLKMLNWLSSICGVYPCSLWQVSSLLKVWPMGVLLIRVHLWCDHVVNSFYPLCTVCTQLEKLQNSAQLYFQTDLCSWLNDSTALPIQLIKYKPSLSFMGSHTVQV